MAKALRIRRTDRKAFLTLLRQARLDVGLRQEDLAEKLNVPQSFVSKIESGERRLDIVELRIVCDALNLSMVDFARRLEHEIGPSDKK